MSWQDYYKNALAGRGFTDQGNGQYFGGSPDLGFQTIDTNNVSQTPQDILAQYLQEGGQGAYNELKSAGYTLPNAYVERTPENVALYQRDRGIATGQTEDWKNSDWEAYMGDENTPGAGTWKTDNNGKLTWEASSPEKDSPGGSWFQQTLGPAAPIVGSILKMAMSSVGNQVIPYVGGAAMDILGQAALGDLHPVGGSVQTPNLLEAGLSAFTPDITSIGSGISDVASSVYEGGKNILNAVLPAGEEGLSDIPGYVAAENSADALYTGNEGTMPEANPEDLGGPTGTGTTNLPGNGLSETTPEPGILQSVTDAVTNPSNIKGAIDVLSGAAGALKGTGEGDMPELPGILTASTPGAALPALPDSLAGDLPDKMTWPDVAPYLPKNWDSMSDADKEAWLITRGGEISKQRRGTFAGNLGGIRGSGSGLDYAELTGNSGGKTILGA